MHLGRRRSTGEFTSSLQRNSIVQFDQPQLRLMGSISNNSRKMSYFAGFYKGIQSAGGAVAAQVDLDATSYLTELVICWALLAGSLVIAAPVILWKVKEEISVEEDLKFSDETLEDVLAPGSIVPKIHPDDV